MKDLKLWQKAGLVAAIVTGLTLGGLIPNYSSKGLESKIPITMGVAEAKTTNPDGYEVPKLVNGPIKSGKFVEEGVEIVLELYDTADGGQAGRYRVGDKIFAYGIDHDKTNPIDYGIYDKDGDGKFETRYEREEEFPVPNWVKQ